VVVDSTDPQGPGAVLFTEAFYRDVRRLLSPGGVMVTQCGNPSIKPQELVDTQAAQRAAGFAAVSYYLTVVPTYVGGAMALGFASDDPGRLRADVATLRARGVPQALRYYTPEMHVAAFAHPAWMTQRVGH
jgi:spermidine synthase